MKKNTLIIILVGIILVFAGITIGLSINIRNSKVNSNDNQANNSLKTNKKQGNSEIKESISNDSNTTSEVEPSQPSQPVEPSQPSQPSQPIEPSQPSQPAEPSQPVQPVQEQPKSNTSTYSTSDTKVIESLETALDNIKNSEVTENFKVNAKATFINVVDFLFYDGTIKGVTFNELTSEGKTKALELANKIDEAIEKKVPNYKDSIASGASKAYKACSELIKKGASNLNSFLQSKLSEENYNSIINSKDDLVYYTKNAVSFLKDSGSKLFSTAKDKLSNWYNKYKNN